MKKLGLILLLFNLLFIACTNKDYEYLSSERDDYRSMLMDVKVYVKDSSIVSTTDLIKKVAKEFPRMNALATRSQVREKEIKDISTLYGENGEPSMYVINYKNNDGWIILSATQEYIPVLAYNDSGVFNVNSINERSVSVWMKEEAEKMDIIKSAPDSIKDYFRMQWYPYTLKKVSIEDLLPAQTRDYSEDLEEAFMYQMQCCAQWEAEGYEIILYGAFKNGDGYDVPTSIRNQIISEAEQYGTDIYDGRDFNTLVLFRRNTTVSAVGPYTTTTWDQFDGNSYYLSNGQPYGCIPVAISQIMKYWEYPNTFNWSSMDTYGSSQASNYLKYQVGLACGINYNSNYSGATLTNARNALNSYGYSQATIVNHNSSTVKTNLDFGRPVLMRADIQGETDGHAWVCDGYRYETYNLEVVLKAMQTKSSFYSHDFGIVGSGSLSVFRMNFGYGGNDNGFYSDNGNTYHVLNSNRKDIVNIFH